MKIDNEELKLNENLYRKLQNICNFSNISIEVIKGIVFKIKNTNVSYIEPHRFILTINDIKIVLLCYDNLNLYLFDKRVPINTVILKELIDTLKGVN